MNPFDLDADQALRLHLAELVLGSGIAKSSWDVSSAVGDLFDLVKGKAEGSISESMLQSGVAVHDFPDRDAAASALGRAMTQALSGLPT